MKELLGLIGGDDQSQAVLDEIFSYGQSMHPDRLSSEQRIRVEALKLAIDIGDIEASTDVLIEKAEVFARYIRGEDPAP